MRLKFVCAVLFVAVIIFSSDAFPSTFAFADSNNRGPTRTIRNPSRNFHFSFVYGRANFDTRIGVVSNYTASGYPYHIISQADPSAAAGQPVLYSFTVEKNINRKVFIGLQYSVVRNQKITGSNWIGAIQSKDPIPVEQFDVEESYSSKFINGTVNYIPVPVNLIDSRLELTIGAGISYNILNASGMQRFERHPNNYEAFDDTTAAFKINKNGFGFLFSGGMDFYWSRHISNQFKLEFRVTPALKVPKQTLTYVTTRKQVRVSDTHTLNKHSIRYSGVILSVSLRFHI